MGYIANFIVYTLAMVGVIVVALLVFKNAAMPGGGKSSKYLKIIDSISLGQRKNLFIISTGKEQFLVAGDVDSTCLISKLDGLGTKDDEVKTSASDLYSAKKTHTEESFTETLSSLPKHSYADKSVLGIKSSMLSEKSDKSVIKNIADILTIK